MIKKLLITIAIILIMPCLWAASPETYNPAGDIYLDEANANSTWDFAHFYIRSSSSGDKRGILQFDFSALPAGVSISNATLSLYYVLKTDNDPVGRVYEARRVVRNDWDYTDASWNDYKTSNTWTTAGASNTTTDVSNDNMATDAVPASYGWMDWNVTAIVLTEQADNEVLNILIQDDAEGSGTNYECKFWSSTHTTSSLRPKLVITYTTSGSFIPTIGVY